MEAGTSKVLRHLFKDNFKKYPFADFEYELNSHPDFPTLKSIADTLDRFGIKNAPVKLKTDEVKQIDSNFLAYIHINGHTELAYVNPDPKGNLYYTSESKSGTFDDFNGLSSIFSGVAVLLDLKKAKLPSPNKTRQQSRFLSKLTLSLIAFCFIAFLTIGILNNSDTLFTDTRAYLLLISKLAGLTLTSLLIFKDIGHSNKFINRVCKIGKQANCNTVLESKYASLYSWIKWSDIGFIYFLSSCFLLANGSEGIIRILTVVAFPYVFISLYQQLFLIKKLCPLCLGIVLLLSLDFCLQVSSINSITLDINTLKSVLIFISFGTIWLAIKSSILAKKDKEELELRYNRIKGIPEVVSAITGREKRLVVPKTPLKSLKFGTFSEDSLKIQVFLSLHCGYCGKLYRELDRLLILSKRMDIHVFLDLNPQDYRQIKFANALLNEHYQQDKQRAWGLIGDWYKQLGKYEEKIENIDPSIHLKELIFTTNHLIKINQISELPKLFIEGFEKSSHYTIDEYLINKTHLKKHGEDIQKEMIINT